MEIASHSQVTFEELNIVLGSINDAYAILAKKYYLPSITSKAITKPYLTKVMLVNTNILRVPNTITKHYVEYKGNTVSEMLEKLEAFLQVEGKPPTGLDQLHLPDYNWIYDVCVWVDPSNKMQIKRGLVTSQNSLTRIIDQE